MFATPNGHCLVSKFIYKGCLTRIAERDLFADFMLPNLFNFDVIFFLCVILALSWGWIY